MLWRFFYLSVRLSFAAKIPLTLELTPSQEQACQTLAYFKIFNYPLRKEEIKKYSPHGDDLDEIFLSNFNIDGSDYFGWELSKKNIQKRILGGIEAEKRLKKGLKRAKFIGKFPFIKSVAISGSLSKGYMEKKSDIDFFIITDPGRLWVARTLLVAYKKIFLLNSRKAFCVNYFVDTNHLEIEEKNRFTATEIVTLIPSYGTDVFQKFYNANTWAYQTFPKYHKNDINVPYTRKGTKKVNEWILSGKLGEALDARFMKMTFKRWQRKFGHLKNHDFDIAFKTRKHVSKHHPGNFQAKVLKEYETNLKEIKHYLESKKNA
jgi:hypothetical protein